MKCFGVKAPGVLIPLRIDIAFSACWLINLALTLILGTGYGGINIGPGMNSIVQYIVCVRTRVYVCNVTGIPIFGEITAGSSRVIAGTAPGVLCRVFL